MIQKLKDDISDLKKLEKGDGDVGKRREGYQEKLRGYEKMLAEEIALEKQIGVWGVIVYDAGEFNPLLCIVECAKSNAFDLDTWERW
jgi:hypothetical protein